MRMTDADIILAYADIVLAHIAELDPIREGGGRDPNSHARKALVAAAETIRGLQAELVRAREQNDLLRKANASLRGVSGVVDPAWHSYHVVRWLRERFAARPEWLPRELELAAARGAIDWPFWDGSPPVLEAGLRIEEREIWAGHTTKVYVMNPAGEGSVTR